MMVMETPRRTGRVLEIVTSLLHVSAHNVPDLHALLLW